VTAAPPSLGYRIRKFTRRHRVAVLAGAVVLLAILGGIAGTTVGMLRAQRARAEAEAVSGFLTELLASASPWQRSNEITVRQLLEEAAGKITNELRDQPAARAELLYTIGTSEFHLGHLDSADRLLREAIRLRTQIEGPDSPLVARAMNVLGLVRKHQDRLPDAERLMREGLRIHEKAYGHEHREVARGLFDLASTLGAEGKNAEAEAAYRESLTLRERLFAAKDPEVDAATVALTMNGLGLHLARTGRPAEAETLIRRSLDIRRRAGSRGYGYAVSLLELGRILGDQQKWAEAEALDREGLAALTQFVEPPDARLTEAQAQLERALHAQGKGGG
jgi:serine/threonine-protein kinase